MELKEFVAETLTQIVDGTVAAQEKVKGKGATVSPRSMAALGPGDPTIIYVANGSPCIQMINFELSLTETEGKEAGARIGVLFGYIGGGGHGKVEESSIALNKVSFSVPLILPVNNR